VVSLLAAAMFGATPEAPDVATIHVDPSDRHQTMEHFGASGAWWAQHVGGWEDDARDRVARLLFDRDEGAGLSLYRYNIGAGDGEHIGDPWRRTETFETAPGPL
jgi:O-glycosyl hydrolase